MRDLLVDIRKALKNPLVRTSLLLGILGAPPLYFSGIYLGEGQGFLAGLLFLLYVAIYTIDCLVTLTIILQRK